MHHMAWVAREVDGFGSGVRNKNEKCEVRKQAGAGRQSCIKELASKACQTLQQFARPLGGH